MMRWLCLIRPHRFVKIGEDHNWRGRYDIKRCRRCGFRRETVQWPPIWASELEQATAIVFVPFAENSSGEVLLDG